MTREHKKHKQLIRLRLWLSKGDFEVVKSMPKTPRVKAWVLRHRTIKALFEGVR